MLSSHALFTISEIDRVVANMGVSVQAHSEFVQRLCEQFKSVLDEVVEKLGAIFRVLTIVFFENTIFEMFGNCGTAIDTARLS